MTTVKQFEATRRNSRKSTGPKTEAGKQASRCNAGRDSDWYVGGYPSQLRQVLEPQVSMVSEIPPFDVALGYELYTLLLKPVEAAWQPAKSSIVATNGALGELPLSLVPTAPAQSDPAAAIVRQLSQGRVARAQTVVPSASAIVTLRRLPRGSPRATS